MIKLFLFFMVISALSFLTASSFGQNNPSGNSDTVAPLLIQPSMNVFRRFEADAEAMNLFYGKVLGFQQLITFNVENSIKVARFQVGDSQVKLSGAITDRSYHRGGVAGATGVRILTFFFTNQNDIEERFKARGFELPSFKPIPGTGRSHSMVKDPDGQWVELVVVPDTEESACKGIEIGLVVSNLARSLDFYRGFVGLEELPPEKDDFFHTTKYSFRHGSTIISLRCFGSELPADTGSGGIQYVVSDAKTLEAMAKSRNIVIDKPLSKLTGFSLLTIWLDDPDGITNYFAQIGVEEN